MNLILVLFLFAPPNETADREARLRELIQTVSQSGRVLEAGSPREKIQDPQKQVAPGAPPLLSFRFFAGADRHRFGKLDVMLDDAGH
jgi:hypothetical protein